MAKSKSVFISYSSRDGKFVNEVVQILEEMGVSCWKAPEMIPAGSSYAKEIPKAIRECEVFLLMLSKTSQDSIWVEKEIDSAISNRKNIIPFQIDDELLNETFRFYLNNVQMISYVQNPKMAMEELKSMLKKFVPEDEVQVTKRREQESGIHREMIGKTPGNLAPSASGKMVKEKQTQQKRGYVRTIEESNALRLNRIPLECKACGSKMLTNVTMGIYRCDDCGEDNYDDYQLVRNYLERVGMASAVVIERETGVPRQVINYFFREEYLEIPKNSSIRVPCERCGAPIRTGVLCDNCKKAKGTKSIKDTQSVWHTRL